MNPTFFGNAGTRYGSENEHRAINELSNALEVDIQKSGLCIDPEDCFLAASPDDLIGNNIIVEIKCPYSAREMSPKDAITKKIIKFANLKNEQLYLNRNHPYYFQVQGQLLVTRKKFCYFAIWTPKGLIYERIKQDLELWSSIRPKLKSFYFDYYLPELIKEEMNQSLLLDVC